MTTNEKYIKRCIELAKNGLGTTYPNPMVGSVIVHDGKIIGEGWHRKAGEPHAEVNAVNSVKDKSLLSKSTIYVSLEPCSHFGKTPPCCDLIIANKIPKVVIGTIDPFAKVAGNGIKKLMEAGINVTVGILEDECNELNKRFFTFHQKKRPYIILKWAETTDLFIAPDEDYRQAFNNNKRPVWITNPFSRQLVHKIRSQEQAILVGTQTVLDDNPKLDVRDWTGNNPIRIVLDRTGKISEDYSVKDGRTKTIIITESQNFKNSENIFYENCTFDSSLAITVSDVLFKHEIQSVIIEGGRQTLQTFIDANLWDEALVFRGNVSFKKGKSAPNLSGNLIKKQAVLDDELLILRNV
ncbi:MAG TPA: bifunctional diaminohydroxyphosphoribosylaminopyrimidine deaminase/5-amino-6-(5-phosphoribosylamino)uracil reductase RibD [Flavobacterium sp.]|uniref:bifunctional diaminohydroxyphosphoribosylaminopyrimidine deaminase/5-amino-6-(5-phosphoribosylamino)uracil reductase RibD n=1 Tax=Flavobacterium sp. TaxID=239 RepID=UPI002C1398B3|nr:bifunctional diaminohydroxyphosphoribosylaminopyrimidine deaminase/5-amino-6-(5-phosphoribosylamino)uracil reductase RibD [Flavobacterium sp.]HSD14343.1 bifunctional diaminohydroxyphosphoribosylaminopyrimidine deaminase/5-amino-6-(5-phosphoribosylamino)uracil reductase RibD [Flavobacterium sp.]